MSIQRWTGQNESLKSVFSVRRNLYSVTEMSADLPNV